MRKASSLITNPNETMEATLKYTLPEEENELRLALEGASAHDIIWDIDQHLRNKLKHEELSEEVEKELESLREMIRGCCCARRVTLDG